MHGLLDELQLTGRLLLELLRQEEMLEHTPHLRTAAALRRCPQRAAPARGLGEVRAAGSDQEDDSPWRGPLLLTINGLAAGLGNTG